MVFETRPKLGLLWFVSAVFSGKSLCSLGFCMSLGIHCNKAVHDSAWQPLRTVDLMQGHSSLFWAESDRDHFWMCVAMKSLPLQAKPIACFEFKRNLPQNCMPLIILNIG